MSQTILLSGKKQGGKSSAGKFILAKYINNQLGFDRFTLAAHGKETHMIDSLNNKAINIEGNTEDADDFANIYSVKLYSFADPLKTFCINVLGLDVQQCYGSDDNKNSKTHISWNDMPYEIRKKYKRPRRGSGEMKPASGLMTAREVMQVFGTDICRKIDTNCWSRGLYNQINKDNNKLSIIIDARFPNEITMGTEVDAYSIRLLREVKLKDPHESEKALDDFPLGEYNLVIDNKHLSMRETHEVIFNNLVGILDTFK